jgi:hypothetical protein
MLVLAKGMPVSVVVGGRGDWLLHLVPPLMSLYGVALRLLTLAFGTPIIRDANVIRRVS